MHRMMKLFIEISLRKLFVRKEKPRNPSRTEKKPRNSHEENPKKNLLVVNKQTP